MLTSCAMGGRLCSERQKVQRLELFSDAHSWGIYTYKRTIIPHLEAKTRFSQQEWNNTNVHNAVFIRPLLGVPIHDNNLTEKVA